MAARLKQERRHLCFLLLPSSSLHDLHTRTESFYIPACLYHCIHYFHIDHNAPCLPPKILHNHCFQFLLGITVVPREIQDNGYAKFEGGVGGGKQSALWSM